MKFKNDIEAQAGFKDKDGQLGSAGQILTSTGSQTDWVDQSTINAGNAEHVVIYAKNTSGASISKGTPVYITGTVGATDTVQIAPADASDSAKMPAVGLLDDTLANNAFGYVITGGFMDNITTDPIDGATPSSNDTVYVKVGGGLTLTKPTGPTGLIQNIAKVGKVSGGNSGSLIVSSILRTNDVPNLTTGKIWVGDGNTIESSVVFLDEPNGRMGINTTTPTKELEIGTNAAAETEFRMHSDESGKYFNIQSAGNFTSVKTAGSQNFILDSSGSSGYITFVTNASERMRVNYNGNVGIGTTSPSDKLEVYNNGGDVAIRIHEDAGTHEAKLHLRRGGSDWELINNNNFTIESEDSEKFRITTTGNVGIGTTNPGVKLHIGPGTASSSTVEEFRIQTGTSSGYGGTAIINLLTGQYGNSGIYFGDQATYSSQPAFIEFQDSPSTLIYKAPVTSGSHVFKIGTSEQVRIAYNGYVGIGMSNPGAKLHVGVSSGSSSTTQEFRLQTQSGGYGGEAIINLRTGQYGTSGVYFGDGLSHTAQPAYIKFIDSSNSLGLKTSGSFSFITNTSTAMYLQSSGLGVGETSPTARLQVKESSITSFTGTGSSAQLRLRGGYTNNEYIILGFSQDTNKDIGRMAVKRGSSGSSFHWGVSTNYGNGITNEAMVLTHQGYLGIKNLSPSYLLDVAGDGRVNGKLRCVTLIQTSQRDQKKDIADINKTKAKAIPFKEYKYKSSIDGSERKRYGVVAEDIENDYPELVHTGADGVKGINYIDLLVKRVAELEKELEDISLTPGPKGSTGATGPAGADGKNGANGNSHLSGVESIAFNEKTGQLEITIGKSTYRFNPAK